MKQHKGWDFGTFEITPREILASVTLIAVMLVFGTVISSNIDNAILDKNEEYNHAVKIKNGDVFQYSMETNVGNAFVYGKLEPVDTVTYKEIGGKYYYISKTREEYRRHEKIEKVKDSKGKIHYKKKVWYSWDEIWSTDKTCKRIKFAGKKFNQNKIHFIDDHYIKDIYTSPHVRYEYYGMEAKPIKGTVYTKLKNNTMTKCDLHKANLQDTVEAYKSDGEVGKWIFWFFWIILTGGLTYAFYYVDNDWLE